MDYGQQQLPNGDRAVVDVEKLRDYCLSETHLRGKHKARVFRARLGIGANDASWLRNQLLIAAHTQPARTSRQDEFGQRFFIDSLMQTAAGSAVVRSIWIVRSSEDFPRLSSCYVR